MFEVLIGDQLTWNIPLLVVLLCFICLFYFLNRTAFKKQIITLQPILFITGLSLLYFMIGSPLLPISHLSFSFHMIQMSMLFFIIPPLILLGTPVSIFDPFRTHLKIKKVHWRWIPPKIALYMFASLFFMYHLPIILQFLSQHTALKFTYISILFILAFHMWWPIATSDTTQRLRKDNQKRYAFLSGWLIMPACVLFIVTAFIDGTQNHFISELAVHLCVPAGAADTLTLLPPPFNTKYDQIMAGVLMMGLHKLSLMMTVRLEKRLPTL